MNLSLDTLTTATPAPPSLGAAVKTEDHVYSVDCLRGIAALAVCCCHAITQGPLSSAAHYGWLGVYVFFVVSGFVIPFRFLSLHS